MTVRIKELFDLTGKTVLITGGAGLLGEIHAEAVAELGASVYLADIREGLAREKAERIASEFGVPVEGIQLDVANEPQVLDCQRRLLKAGKAIDVLINNAAKNPQVKDVGTGCEFSRIENFPLTQWDSDLSIGLNGAFICSKIFGSEMARRKQGVILNISSDLGVHAPDQRIYGKEALQWDQQPVKPLSYAIAKAGLISLTQYLATYWADRNVRVNAIAPGGVVNNQPAEFVRRLSALIPLGRMAEKYELKGAVALLCSDASSYITGVTLVIDGGRAIW